MKTPEEIIREMRGWEYESYRVIAKWAGALEQAMREPVAEYTALPDGLEWRFRPQIFDPPVGTKLFAFPPDAATVIRLEVEHSALLVGEIERLSDRLKWFEDSGSVAVHAEVFKRGAEIERLREALQQIANRAIPIQREEHRIARTALAKEDSP